MPRPKKVVDKTIVRRKVFFYRVSAGTDESGAPKTINFGPALSFIDKLPFGPDGRYLAATKDEKELCCWIERAQSPYRFKLAFIRRSEHPPVEQDGQLSPLVLGGKQGLAE